MNAPVEQVNQLIYNMVFIKGVSNKVFGYIDPFSEILSYIAWVIRDFYHVTLKATTGQDLFGRYIITKLM